MHWVWVGGRGRGGGREGVDGDNWLCGRYSRNKIMRLWSWLGWFEHVYVLDGVVSLVRAVRSAGSMALQCRGSRRQRITGPVAT